MYEHKNEAYTHMSTRNPMEDIMGSDIQETGRKEYRAKSVFLPFLVRRGNRVEHETEKAKGSEGAMHTKT